MNRMIRTTTASCRSIHRQLIVLLLMLANQTNVAAEAQDKQQLPLLSLKADRKTARIVEPILLTLAVEAPLGSTVVMPNFSDQLGPFEVQSVVANSDLPTDDADIRRWTSVVTIDTLKTGKLNIPPLEVLYRLPNDSGDFRRLSSDPIELQIVSVLEDRADPTNFRDVKPVVDVQVPPITSYAWAWWLAGGSSLVAALVVGTVLLSRRKPTIAPADWAIGEVAKLEASFQDRKLDGEMVCSELAHVIREFVQLQYLIDASSQSTPELLSGLTHKTVLPADAHDPLNRLLTVADEVKFSRLSLTTSQVGDVIGNAKQFVRACGQPSPPQEMETANVP